LRILLLFSKSFMNMSFPFNPLARLSVARLPVVPVTG
jgi:hypothetical protein